MKWRKRRINEHDKRDKKKKYIANASKIVKDC
jgi:hypothetical protein